MPLTKDFKENVRARLVKSAGFRKAVLQEAVDGLLAGDLDTGKALLRDYVNGTMGFERLGELTQIPVKSLMRMLGPKGNPQAKNLFDVIAHLQRAEGLRFEVSLKSRAKVRVARASAGFAQSLGRPARAQASAFGLPSAGPYVPPADACVGTDDDGS